MVGMSIPLWAAQTNNKLSGAKSGVRAAESDQENIKRQTLRKTHLGAQIDASDRGIQLLKHKESLLNASRGAQTRNMRRKSDFSMPENTGDMNVRPLPAGSGTGEKHTALIADFNHYFIKEKKMKNY